MRYMGSKSRLAGRPIKAPPPRPKVRRAKAAPRFFKNGKARPANLASLPDDQNLKFEREDWTSFRTIEGLEQKAGVNRYKLRRLVLKELTDNGLDTGANVEVSQSIDINQDDSNDDVVYTVTDDGQGIDGTPEEIARLFSIRRPMVSTKLLRLPTRGALGNGLRVVAGAVLASGGSLVVTTRGRRIRLRPERDGSTVVLGVRPDKTAGTRIEISFGKEIPDDEHALFWANAAIRLAAGGQGYAGRSSPHWYDAAQFHELLEACGNRPVRDLIANLDGCTGARAGEIVAEARLGRKLCADINREQAAKLLEIAKGYAGEVNPERLGALGAAAFFGASYGCFRGTADSSGAAIPFVVEAWASKDPTTSLLFVCVNRTPVTSEIVARRDKRDIDFFGCGLHHTVATAPREVNFDIWFNVTTPYMPITSDGKEPDLHPFLDGISAAVGKAIKGAHRPGSTGKPSQKAVVLDNLDSVVAEQRGDREYRYNMRQLFYALRPIVRDELGEELKIENFTGIITDYEAEHGEIPGMYREPRGSITHPHRDETITLGTLMVENYERPVWLYNKLVYIEKEGASEALKAERWGERHDCAVLSSKGFSTRAARDLIDKLAEHDEPIEVFCVHDADAAGGMIYQTLQEATKARGARKIKIINLGLEPWEAIDMGLDVEDVDRGKRSKAVADYVKERDNGRTDLWEDWLQDHRVELNAMTTPEFIAWLDGKMTTYEKLVPPDDVLTAEFKRNIESKLREAIVERILREANVEEQVAAAIAAIEVPDAAALVAGVEKMFERTPDAEWRNHIEEAAALKIEAAE
jgi:hypothetical protein